MIKQEKIDIEGMTCDHCVRAVKQAIEELGATPNHVVVGKADISYDTEKTSRDKLILAIEEEGYKVVGS